MIGPLIDKVAYDTMRLSLEQATVDGGKVSGVWPSATIKTLITFSLP